MNEANENKLAKVGIDGKLIIPNQHKLQNTKKGGKRKEEAEEGRRRNIYILALTSLRPIVIVHLHQYNSTHMPHLIGMNMYKFAYSIYSYETILFQGGYSIVFYFSPND